MEKLLVTSNFSFSHNVFKRLVSQGRQKASLCGNGLKLHQLYYPLPDNPDFQRPLAKYLFEKIVWKEENAGDQHVILVQQCFLSLQEQISIYESDLFFRGLMLSIWINLKFCLLLMG